MSASPNHSPIRPDWLATHHEAAIEPSVPVVDSHHHLYERPGLRYLLDDYLVDIGTGHDVQASVFVQARAMLRQGVAPEWQPVGEVEFVNGIAAMSASGIYGKPRVCAGIVGYADFWLGDRVRPILERLIMAGGGTPEQGGRFCGIRQTLCWDPDPSLLNAAYPTAADMMQDARFRAGFAHLAPLGLSFEAWAFYHQLSDVAALARAFPDTQIVLNHCGGLVRVHDHAGRADYDDVWKAGVADLAACPNVSVKLSGLGMKFSGFRFEDLPRAPDSATLAETWRPWVEPFLERFGASRCMYGSNFPVDKGSYSFKVGVNALKRLVAGASAPEKHDIFWRTAKRFYRLSDAVVPGA